MDGPLSLAGSLVEHLSGVAWEGLAIALSAHAAKATVRTRAWWNILAATYPGDHIRWRVALAAHLAGVGVNAVAPARGSGEVVKLYLVRREIAGAKYPTLTATLAVEMVFDLTAASALLAWAAQAGALPPLGTPPIGPALAAALLAGVLCAAAFASRARARLAPLARSLVQGLMVLRRGRLYLRHVALWQATDWLLRLVTATGSCGRSVFRPTWSLCCSSNSPAAWRHSSP